jgi:hypothetical protein
MNRSDCISEFVYEGRKESERAEVVFRKEFGDSGFCLKAKGGKKAVEKLINILNEALEER